MLEIERLESPLTECRLMIPGPIELAPEVLAEMARPLVPHYGAEWTAFYNETVEGLRTIFRTSGDVFLIPGSGSAGLDAAIGSVLGPQDRMLVLSNGFFGERIGDIARRYRKNTRILSLPEDRPVTARTLQESLAADPEITVVGVVHSESSSGLLNPVRDLAAVCRRMGRLMLVDAVSSLGGIELDMDEWGIDLCVSASQKCLEGPPGLGIVAVGERAWKEMRGKETPGWYLNLKVWKEFAEKWALWHPFPVTMAVPAVRALRAGIARILEEGIESRFRRHRAMASYARGQLQALGFVPVFDEAVASPTVLSFYGRDDLAADTVVDRLEHEYRIRVGGGMGCFSGKAFRIGNMGPQADRAKLDVLILALRAVGRARCHYSK